METNYKEKLKKIKVFVFDVDGVLTNGDLFIFPAHLPHGVEENKSDDDRIVISFNIIINNFKN